MLVVSYATPGLYQRELDRLTTSIGANSPSTSWHVRLNVWAETWSEAVGFKPAILSEAREAFDGPLLWLDADAVVHLPLTLTRPDSVAMYRYYGRRQEPGRYQTGTIYLADDDTAREFLRCWLEVNAEERAKGRKDGFGQATVDIVAQRLPGVIGNLPEQYCRIFDRQEPCGGVVVEHLQASREWRYADSPDHPKLLARRKRCAEIEAELGMVTA